MLSHRKSNAASLVRKLVLPPFGGIGAGGGYGESGGVRPEEVECSHTVYYGETNSIPL